MPAELLRCAALMDAGHEARLLADGATLGTAASLGIPANALAGDMRQRSLAAERLSIQRCRQGRWLRQRGERAGADCQRQRRSLDAGSGGCAWRRLRCDYHVGAWPRSWGCPLPSTLGMQAIGTVSLRSLRRRPSPSPFLPPKVVPRLLNRVSQSLVNAMLWWAFRKATNAARVKVCGLAPRREGWTSHPMLYGISPCLLPRTWRLASECPNLRSVDPAVAGLVPAADTQRLPGGRRSAAVRGVRQHGGVRSGAAVQEMVAAVDRTPCIVLSRLERGGHFRAAIQFFRFGDTPHDWLVPRTSLVVHHGGSGTTHSATQAGVSSVVVPFVGDQHFWADRLEHLGVAPNAVNGKGLRARELARGIELAEGNVMRSRARAVGEAMSARMGWPMRLQPSRQ